jgi:undecaprenyl diphosphate synthase
MDNLDMNRIPEHIAIIMDGNGRWATERGKERSYGHQAGVDTVRRITSECTRLGVKYLTLYTFSTENWNRPASPKFNLSFTLYFAPMPKGTFAVNTFFSLPFT